MPKWELQRERYLSLTEVKQLVKVCEGRASADSEKGRLTWPKVWTVVHTGLESGLRVSERKDLNCGDLFLKNGEPYLIVKTGKGGNRSQGCSQVVAGGIDKAVQLQVHLFQVLLLGK